MKRVLEYVFQCAGHLETENSQPFGNNLPKAMEIAQSASPKIGSVVCQKWSLCNKISTSGDPEIFSAIDQNGNEVVIKMGASKFLHHEIEVYLELHHIVPDWGLPEAIFAGTELGEKVLVLAKLGPSISSLVAREGGTPFNLNVVIFITGQLIYHLETLHNIGFVHGRIEPGNILVGNGTTGMDTIYLIDFQRARKYRFDTEVIMESTIQMTTVTFSIAFSPASYHDGASPSRADDLESMLYVMVYMYRLSLPWLSLCEQGCATLSDEIGKMKRNIEPKSLFRDMPKSLHDMLSYIRSIARLARPDYHKLRTFLSAALDI